MNPLKIFLTNKRSITKNEKNKKNLKTYKRASYILPEYLDHIIYVYNGMSFKKLRITEDMIGTKFGQYVFTRKICKHKIKKVIKK